MPVTLTVNGTPYSYPKARDKGWGQAATGWATAVTAVISHLRSPNLPIATAGQIRLGNEDSLQWRNADDTGNISLFVDDEDRLIYDDGVTQKDLSLTGGGNVQNSNPATANSVVRFDGPSGGVIKDSDVIIDDSNNISGINDLDIDGTATIDDADIDTADIATLTATILNVLGSVDIAAALNVGTDLDVADDLSIGGDLDLTGTATITDSLNVGNDFTIADAGSVSNINGTINLGAGTGTSALNITTDNNSVNASFANASFDSYTRPAAASSQAVRGIALSSSSGSFSTTSASFVDITNLSVTLAITGRPVVVKLIPDGGSSSGFISVNDTDSNSAQAEVQFLADGVVIAVFGLKSQAVGSTTTELVLPASAFSSMHFTPDSSVVYKAQLRIVSSANRTATATNVKLLAYEL